MTGLGDRAAAAVAAVTGPRLGAAQVRHAERRRAPGRTVRRMRLERGDDTLHVVVAEPPRNDGPPRSTVVLAHGAGASHLAFFHQIDQLSSDLRVVAWDQRGFGASSGPTQVPDPDQGADDLLAVLDALDPAAGPVHLVGQSLGGWAMTRAVLAQPDRISSLTLSGSVGGMFSAGTRASLGAFIDAVLYQLLDLLPGPGAAAVERIAGSTVDPADLVATGVPLLFIVGEHDAVFGAGDVARLAASLPGAELQVVASAGHSPCIEQPDRFCSVLRDFLDRIEAQQRG